MSIWLDFIGLPNLKEIFGLIFVIYNEIASNSIDGSCLELIEEKELEEDLMIQHKIVRKKLRNCINYTNVLYRD